MADSRDVAAYFGKERRSVLQSIPELNCSDDFRRHNFVLISLSMISSRVAILLPAELRPSELSSRHVGKFRV